jgi:chaperone modulatory protein CbpM
LTSIDTLILEEQTAITLAELCRACAAPAETIIALVEEGVLTPTGTSPTHWRFGGMYVRRARIALRLQRDLGINLPGVALALQLLEEVETMRNQLLAANITAE